MMRLKRATIAVYAGLAAGFALAAARTLIAPDGVLATDFSVFCTAWWLILHHQGAALYDAAAQTAAQHVVMNGAHFEGGLMAFLNPPHAALAGLPFGWLADHAGERIAFAAWSAGNVGLLVVLDRWLRQSVGATAGSTRWLVTFALIASYPVFEVIRIGQVSLLLAVAALGLYRAVERSRPMAGAAWLLVLSIKPQLLLPVFVFLAVRGAYRLLTYAAAMGVAAAAVTSLALGPTIWVEYVRHVGQLEHYFATGTPDYMLSVRGVLARLAFLDESTIGRVSFALSIGTSGLLAGVLWFWRTRARDDIRTAYALTIATALLFSPHLFVQDTVLWAIPLALAWEPGRRLGTAFAFSLPLLFALSHLVRSGQPRWMRPSLDFEFIMLTIILAIASRAAFWHAACGNSLSFSGGHYEIDAWHRASEPAARRARSSEPWTRKRQT